MKFTINGRVTVSCFTTVEADTEEEAYEIAAERELAGLCHMPFDSDHDEAWHIETDGEPEIDAPSSAGEAGEMEAAKGDGRADR